MVDIPNVEPLEVILLAGVTLRTDWGVVTDQFEVQSSHLLELNVINSCSIWRLIDPFHVPEGCLCPVGVDPVPVRPIFVPPVLVVVVLYLKQDDWVKSPELINDWHDVIALIQIG